MTKAIELTLKNVAPFQGAQKDGPLLKMAMFEEDIWVNKDEEVGPIGPRATSTIHVYACSTAGISQSLRLKGTQAWDNFEFFFDLNQILICPS